MGKTNPPDTENNGPKELVRLCRAGRLYEIERWLNDGKSLEIPAGTYRGRQRSLVEIAVETGFHSLVDLIAKHIPDILPTAAVLCKGLPIVAISLMVCIF